jgi:pyruvate dehydrogenase E2 component (dihydrolipoamide acetyltransferase)
MPIEIRMPELSADMVEADLVSWLVEVGDRIEVGDLIAEIETDKATVELEADAAGVLTEIRVTAGTTEIEVGAVLAVLEVEATAEATPADSPAASASLPPSDAPVMSATAGLTSTPVATALAKRIADQGGVALTSLDGSGPGGKIVKRDVESALGANRTDARDDSSAVPREVAVIREDAEFTAPFTRVPHSRMRRTIATRLTAAKLTIPHFYLRAECHLDRLLAARRELNQAPDVSISVNDFVIRAIALALRAVPEAHVAWRDDSLLRFERADISVAVATDDGLVTPIVHGADRKGLAAIANEMRDLAGRARNGKLRPEEYRGGTFTVSNLGMFGVESVTPILNPPQSGILGVGAGVERPVVRDGPDGRDGRLGVATIMVVTLAADHRALDGAAGARLLAAFKEFIDEPLEMIL